MGLRRSPVEVPMAPRKSPTAVGGDSPLPIEMWLVGLERRARLLAIGMIDDLSAPLLVLGCMALVGSPVRNSRRRMLRRDFALDFYSVAGHANRAPAFGRPPAFLDRLMSKGTVGLCQWGDSGALGVV